MFQQTWHDSWNDLMTKTNIKLLDDIELEIGNGPYYPNKNNVLRFLNVNLNDLSYVVVGMDPYPSWDCKNNCPQATGRSFEVSELINKTWDFPIQQNSLINILKSIYYNETGKIIDIGALRRIINTNQFNIAKPGVWFDNIESQGVLFLNASLTVKPNNAGSHESVWEPFREVLIPYIEKEINPQWMLWGRTAQNTFKKYLTTDKILEAPHPRMTSFIEKNTFQFAKEINWLGN